jgi:hypothetical protein
MRAEFRGLQETINKLKVLRPALARRVLRNGLRKGASIVNKAAKANLGQNGPLKKSLGVKVTVSGSMVVAVVEPRAGFRILVRTTKSGRPIYNDPRRIAHLKERGTNARRTKKGFNRGSQRAEPYLYPAATANESKVEAAVAAEAEKELGKL